MELENAEKIQTEQVAPAPVTPTPQVETTPTESTDKVENPSTGHDEAVKKQNAAFAQMRRAKRELEKKANTTNIATPPPVAPVVVEQPKPEPIAVATAPVQNNTEGIEIESERAIMALAADKDLAKISGGVYEVVSLVDSDPRLMRLHAIDPTLAFREAKEIYLSKAGISTPPPVPKSNTPSGGTGAGAHSLDALYAETQKHTIGTREWHKAVNSFNSEAKRLNS
jgi:hypothetical protein